MGDPVTHRRRAFALLTASAALLAGAVTAAPAATAAPTAAAAPKKCYTQSTIGLTCHHHYGKKWAERGSTGAHVKEIQALINGTTTYYKTHGKALAVDGIYGAGTQSAVRWFQKKYIGASAVDGIVGPRTWDALRGYRN
ncbi:MULTISPECIES: peptidoglycan-binding domain-containing protein [Streptomyces]|uniref:Peptidoglycan-binding protein n=1 Tax=Streptomyces koyangensis TaxID=188770 RepID=A0A385DG25_9ACTN|nr:MULTISPECIES: peptidoglycan-binding protein [Streptomyces]AXQ57226.1 peptidoglycan-binding protein [Streptomyces koyangensis]PKR42552.1 peptidoglycan-binding protein [Streptomyces sp. EAG2]QRF02233.1 peptidoglycan-binding protein [Streptomyces koyangensis]